MQSFCTTYLSIDNPIVNNDANFMSDLAPFVAATLKDKVVTDLHEENKQLRAEKHASQLVEITCPKRHPVYAQGHLKNNGKGALDGREESFAYGGD